MRIRSANDCEVPKVASRVLDSYAAIKILEVDLRHLLDQPYEDNNSSEYYATGYPIDEVARQVFRHLGPGSPDGRRHGLRHLSLRGVQLNFSDKGLLMVLPTAELEHLDLHKCFQPGVFLRGSGNPFRNLKKLHIDHERHYDERNDFMIGLNKFLASSPENLIELWLSLRGYSEMPEHSLIERLRNLEILYLDIRRSEDDDTPYQAPQMWSSEY